MVQTVKQTPEQLQAKRKAQVAAVRAALITPQGKDMLAALLEEYDGLDLVGATPYDTYYRVGQRDLVKTLQHIAESEND